MNCIALLLLTSAALLAFTSCAVRDGALREPGLAARWASPLRSGVLPLASLPPLPTPASLQPEDPPSTPRSGSYLNANLQIAGQDFDPALPSNRVTAQIGDALYGPDWTQSSTGFGGLAYAIYNFELPGYDGSPELSWEWDGAAPTGVFVLLANFETGRWDVFAGTPSSRLEFANLEPYLSLGGRIFAGIILTGTSVQNLFSIRVGATVPEAALSAAPTSGAPPLGVDFDASASLDPEGAIVEYRWDPEGDGSFDLSTGTDPQLHFDYLDPGSFNASVQVTEEAGMRDEASVNVSVIDALNFSFGSDEDEEARAVFDSGDGAIIVAANSGTPDEMDVLVARVTPNQNLLFAKAWSLGDSEQLLDAKLGSDGSIYLCGVIETAAANDRDALLQKWSPAGELLWSKRLHCPDNELLMNGLEVVANSIFVCGTLRNPTLTRDFGMVLCLDTAGSLVWATDIIGPHNISMRDIRFRSSQIFGEPDELHVVGHYHDGSNQDAAYFYFEVSKTLLASKTLGGPSVTESASELALGSASFEAVVYVAIQGNVAGTSLLSQVGGASVSFNTPENVILLPTVLSRPAGQLSLLCFETLGDSSSFNIDFNTAFELQDALSISVAGGNCVIQAQTSFAEGTLLAGSTTQDAAASAPHTIILGNSTLTWQSVSPAQGFPIVEVTDTGGTVADAGGVVFNNHAGDKDIALFLMEAAP